MKRLLLCLLLTSCAAQQPETVYVTACIEGDKCGPMTQAEIPGKPYEWGWGDYAALVGGFILGAL